MKILVPIKRVVDYHVNVRVKPDGSAVDLNNVKMSINPFDEIALEEAIRLKEKGLATEVVVLSIGEGVNDILRKALALGADKAIVLETSVKMRPLEIAKLLKAFIKSQDYGLVIMGKQSIDGDNNQTGQMLSALLDWPQATFASKIVLTDEKATVTREIDGGLETLSLRLPAIITTDLRLNEPRFASLPNIMKAKSKPLEVIDAASFGVPLLSAIESVKFAAPSARVSGVKVNDVAELMDKLVNEAKVLG